MLQRLLRRDLVIRVLAVLVALILWLQLTSEQTQITQQTYDVPLSVHAAPAGYVNYEQIRDTVQITISGPRRLLQRFNSSTLQAWVDLGAAAENHLSTAEVQMTPLQNDQLHVVGMSPDRLAVNLVKIDQEQRPLVLLTQPMIQGDQRFSIVTGVTHVTLTGPKAKLSAIQQVAVSVDYSLFDETTDVTLAPRALDAEGKPVAVNISPAQVKVQVKVEPLPPGRAVPVKVQLQGALPPDYQVSTAVEPASVVIREADSKTPPALTEIYTEPISLVGHSSSFTQKVAVALPKGMTADQGTVTVSVSIGQPWQQRAFKDLPIRVDGVSGDLAIKAVTDPESKGVVTTVQVVLAGTRETLDALQSISLQPYVDATGQLEGDATLPVKLILPPGVSLVRVSPDQVTLSLGKR